jgi:hypothetical protein
MLGAARGDLAKSQLVEQNLVSLSRIIEQLGIGAASKMASNEFTTVSNSG